ncbi:MAG: undecaprenyl-diphosphate phosphatase, partial [Candidatus Odinarchaeia archaeon]
MWALLILAVMQGVLEWLPVSSQGQSLIILVNIFGIDIDVALSITLWLHVGTMIAVVYFYRKEYLSAIKGETEESRIIRKFLIIATLTTAIAAVPLFIILINVFPRILGDFIAVITGIFLLVTGLVIYFSKKKYGEKDIFALSNTDMILAGLFQGFAILPGISRSGITIAFLLIMGYRNKTSLKLSFMMSAPAVLGGIILNSVIGTSAISYGIPVYILTLIVIITAIVGLLTIKILTKAAQKINFAYFCILMSIITIVMAFTFMALSGGFNIFQFFADLFYWLYDVLRDIILIIGPLGLFIVMILQAIIAPIPS